MASDVILIVCTVAFLVALVQITNDRLGLTRSAIFLLFFIIIHAVGSVHVFKVADDFNGYDYFYVRLYWIGFGQPANFVEGYLMRSVLLYVAVGLKRTWDMKLKPVQSNGVAVLNLPIAGLTLMTFMTIHLFQFRFGGTQQFGSRYIRTPPYMINFWGLLTLDLLRTRDTSVSKMGCRDIYAVSSAASTWRWLRRNFTITDLALMTFIAIHLFQLRFGGTQRFGSHHICPPPYMINFWCLLALDLLWTRDTSVPKMCGCDIYALSSAASAWRWLRRNLAISGLMLMTLMTIRLVQFRFGDNQQFAMSSALTTAGGEYKKNEEMRGIFPYMCSDRSIAGGRDMMGSALAAASGDWFEECPSLVCNPSPFPDHDPGFRLSSSCA